MSPKRRRRLFVDFQLQGKLLARTMLYWLYCLLSVAFIASCWIVCVERPATSSDLFHSLWFSLGPAILGSLVLIPLVVMDCLRLSNRFAGPMLRFRRAMKALVEEQPTPLIKLRKGDFWTDFADDLNRLIERQNSAASESSQTAGDTATTDEPAVSLSEFSTQTERPNSPLDVHSDISV